MSKLSDNLSECVMLGRVHVDPKMLARVLKNISYYMHYDKKSGLLSLQSYEVGGSSRILEAERVSFETAERLAKELGLKMQQNAQYFSYWGKYVDRVTLLDDKSPEVMELEKELLLLEIPYRKQSVREEPGIRLNVDFLRIPRYSKDELLEMIRKHTVAKKKKLQPAT